MNTVTKALLKTCGVSNETIKWLDKRTTIEFNAATDELIVKTKSGKGFYAVQKFYPELRRLPFKLLAFEYKGTVHRMTTATIDSCNFLIHHNDYSNRLVDW